ncbi:MAG: glucosyltransferase domain-containing protein [Eubacteriales bacterium]|nr:glucosyltransferase domain-containing protein [Eubacteriales bacterium]
MARLRKILNVFISAPLSLFFALVFSYYSGYLREYSLFESVQKLGLACLRYGRKQLLILTAVLFIFLAFTPKKIKLEKMRVFWSAFFSCLLTVLVFLRDGIGAPAFRVLCWGFIFLSASFLLFLYLVYDFEVYLANKNRIKILKDKEYKCAQRLWTDYKYPFVSTVIFGFIAYGWFFVNKILNFDELYNLFGKGAEIESGRWGLPLVSYLIPDVSIPWLWGIIALIMMAVSVCLIVNITGIKNHILQCLVAGVIVSFPAETATMLYMFTVPSYAFAFLLSVFSVKIISTKQGKRALKILLAVLFEVFSVSIYQANVAVTSTLLVLLLIFDLIHESEAEGFFIHFLKKSISYLVFLIISMALYYSVTLVIQKVTGIGFTNYSNRALENSRSVFQKVLYALNTFGDVYSKQINGIVRSEVSEILHVIVIHIGYFSGFYYCIKKNFKWKEKILLFSLYAVILLPLSISCLNLFLNPLSLHAVTMMSYAMIFVFSAKMVELVSEEDLLPGSRNIISLLISVIIIFNTYYSNVIGLRMYIEYENAYSAYTTILSDMQSLPDYKAEYKIALAGVLPEGDFMENFGLTDENSVFGVSSFRNNYSRNELIQQYLGYDVQFASSREVNIIRETEEYKDMPVYPNYGFIRIIDNYVVVKLSEKSEGYFRSN